MDELDTLHAVLHDAIAQAQKDCTDATTKAKDAAKAFKAGLEEFFKPSSIGHAAACANTGDAATCPCLTATSVGIGRSIYRR